MLLLLLAINKNFGQIPGHVGSVIVGLGRSKAEDTQGTTNLQISADPAEVCMQVSAESGGIQFKFTIPADISSVSATIFSEKREQMFVRPDVRAAAFGRRR